MINVCGSRGVSSHGAYAPDESNKGYIAPSKYAPDGIQNSMILPLMKKAQTQTPKSLFSYNKIFSPLLVCFSPKAELFLGGRKNYHAIRTRLKILPPPPVV